MRRTGGIDSLSSRFVLRTENYVYIRLTWSTQGPRRSSHHYARERFPLQHQVDRERVIHETRVQGRRDCDGKVAAIDGVRIHFERRSVWNDAQGRIRVTSTLQHGTLTTSPLVSRDVNMGSRWCPCDVDWDEDWLDGRRSRGAACHFSHTLRTLRLTF